MSTPKLTTELVDKLVGLAREGRFRKHCAQQCGLSPAVLDRWLSEGREAPGGRYGNLATRFDAAVAESAGELAAVVKGAATTKGNSGDWRAAAWLLERRFPLFYGARAEVVADHDDVSATPTATDESPVYSPFKTQARSA
jgi:hypothetical protein